LPFFPLTTTVFFFDVFDGGKPASLAAFCAVEAAPVGLR
jgi:hypothetical protein